MLMNLTNRDMKMPPPPKGITNQQRKKKKKGNAPAHQNKFAFKHNPKSKTTERILNSPNVHVCRRCHDKIEWRKQYRKYKPRTQPGICNECKKRSVLFAYHTLCTKCTTDSIKAKEIIHQHIPEETESEKQHGNVDGSRSIAFSTSQQPKNFRACAICVKEIALPDQDDTDGKDNDLTDGLGRIRLRERRAIERKLAKEENGSRSKSTDDDDESSREHDDSNSVLVDRESDDDASSDMQEDEQSDGHEEDDPFLRAIGGADQLLTGDAYRQKLLERQMQRTQQKQKQIV